MAHHRRPRLAGHNIFPTRTSSFGLVLAANSIMEAAIGFEPMNKGFANLRLGPLGYAAMLKNSEA